MPSEMLVRRIFQRLLGSLKNYFMNVMRRRGPNMSLLPANFTHQDSLWIVWWDLMPSTRTVTLEERKWLLRPRTFVLRTRTNQKSSSCTKLYCRVVLRARNNQKTSSPTKLYCRVVLRRRTNKKASYSTKLYRRAVPRTRTNYVLRRNANHNALSRNKNTQIMRLHMLCQTILTSLMYLNAK